MPHKDKEKRKEYAKAWYKRNRERKAATDKAWRERNRERVVATEKSWYERNSERKKASDKAWRERNRERVVAYRKSNRERRAATDKAWRERNRERVVVRSKDYRERNRDLINENRRKRRCRKKNASIYLTANENQQIIILERTRQELQRETGRDYHIDHILPIIHGGIHHPVNLRILDGRENESKHDKLFPEAIALAPEHFRLYSERVGPERAWEFVRQLAKGLGLDEEDLDELITGKPLKKKSTLEDLMT